MARRGGPMCPPRFISSQDSALGADTQVCSYGHRIDKVDYPLFSGLVLAAHPGANVDDPDREEPTEAYTCDGITNGFR